MQEKNLGQESLEVSTTLNRLGLCQRDLNKLPQAEVSLKRALAIREKRLPPNHLWIALSLQNLASVYIAQHQDEKASALLERSQTICPKRPPAR
jgi:Tfp pilus assembly protein PilF